MRFGNLSPRTLLRPPTIAKMARKIGLLTGNRNHFVCPLVLWPDTLDDLGRRIFKEQSPSEKKADDRRGDQITQA